MAKFLGIQMPSGQPVGGEPVLLFNRSGDDSVPGGVYALDVTGTHSETNPFNKLRNAVEVAAGNIDGLLVVATDVTKPGEVSTRWTGGGPVKVLVNGNGTNIAAGDKLKPTAGENYLVKSSATTDVVVAIALESATTDGALIAVYFFGANQTPDGTAS